MTSGFTVATTEDSVLVVFEVNFILRIINSEIFINNEYKLKKFSEQHKGTSKEH